MSLRVHSAQTPKIIRISSDTSFGRGFYEPPSASDASLARISWIRKVINEHGMICSLLGTLFVTFALVMINFFLNPNNPQK